MKVITRELDVPQNTNDVTKSYEMGSAYPGTLFLQVDGSADATYHFEGSVDGKTWFDMTKNLYDLVAAAYLTTTFSHGTFAFAPATGTPSGVPRFSRIKCVAQNTTPATGIHASMLDSHSA